MITRRFLKWSRKLHKWIGVYIGMLTIIWLVEMIVLPPIFNPGLHVVVGPQCLALPSACSAIVH